MSNVCPQVKVRFDKPDNSLSNWKTNSHNHDFSITKSNMKSSRVDQLGMTMTSTKKSALKPESYQQLTPKVLKFDPLPDDQPPVRKPKFFD